MDTQGIITQLKQFRQQVYQSFSDRADALMDLVDELSSNTTARSVTELSLSPLFRREYSSLPVPAVRPGYDTIDNFFRPPAPRPPWQNAMGWSKHSCV